MKIYTKTGDDGSTGLYGGVRVLKNDPRVEAYGTVDEANAALGVARSLGLESDIDVVLAQVQSMLFNVGAELATPATHGERLQKRSALVTDDDAHVLEQAIDRYEAELPPLSHFVLPGGSKGAAALHMGRVICRRAERCCLTLRQSAAVRPEVIIYLNRLSDLLFVMARLQNQRLGVADTPWLPRADGST